MNDDADGLAARIAQAGRGDVATRLHDALRRQAAEAGLELSGSELDRLTNEGMAHADGTLWRRALAGAAAAELDIGLAEAATHPAVVRAHALTGAPPYPDEPSVQGLRIAAIHLGGIEALRAGEGDLELRISTAGLDVLKRSTGAAIGRLGWDEIKTVELPRARRGLRPGRRVQELHIATGRGRASFELPGLTEGQLKEHLEPMLARTRGGAADA